MIQIQKNEKNQKEKAKNKAAPPTPAAQAAQAAPAAPAAQAAQAAQAAPAAPPTPAAPAAPAAPPTPAAQAAQAAPPAPAKSPIPPKKQLTPLPGAKEHFEKAKKLIKTQNAKAKAKEAKAKAEANAADRKAKENKEFAQKVMKKEIINALGENKNLYAKYIKDNKLNSLFNLRKNPEKLKEEIVNSIEDEKVRFKLKQPHEKMNLPTLIKIYNARSNNKKGEVRELIIPKIAIRSINTLISESLNIPDELVQAALISRIQSSKTSPGTSITNPELLRSLRLYVNNRNRKVNKELKQLVNEIVPLDKLTTQQAFQKALKVTRKPGGNRKSKKIPKKVLEAAIRTTRENVEKQAKKQQKLGQNYQAQRIKEEGRAQARRRATQFASQRSRRSARRQVLNEIQERQLEEISKELGKSPYSPTPRFARNRKPQLGGRQTYANVVRTQPEPPAPTVDENFTITPKPKIPSNQAQQLRNQPHMFNVGTPSRPQTPRSRPGSASGMFTEAGSEVSLRDRNST